MNLKKYILDPKAIIIELNNKGILLLNDKKYLGLIYRRKFHKKLDLYKPNTFNEKIQWLKSYNRKPEYIKMVDKYEAKEFVKGIIGDKYIIPTLGVYNNFESINF